MTDRPKADLPRRRRGTKRRTEILEATLRLLARDGASVITHRSVAREAGVPIAATTYYFSSTNDLIAQAFRRHAEKEARRVAEATVAIDEELTQDQLADQLAEFLHHGLFRARSSLIAEYELLLEAARKPELESYSRIFYDTIEAQLERTLEAIGSEDPEADARIIMATLAGLEVDNLATPSTAPVMAKLKALMHRLLDALLSTEGPPVASHTPTERTHARGARPLDPAH